MYAELCRWVYKDLYNRLYNRLYNLMYSLLLGDAQRAGLVGWAGRLDGRLVGRGPGHRLLDHFSSLTRTRLPRAFRMTGTAIHRMATTSSAAETGRRRKMP